MSEQLTDAELKELERLDREATPGSWFVKSMGYGMDRLTPVAIVLGDTDSIDWTDTDYNLVCAARNALPKLLAACRRNAAEAEGLRELLQCWRKAATESREESGRIRRTVKVATSAEERCLIRAEVWEWCADALNTALARGDARGEARFEFETLHRIWHVGCPKNAVRSGVCREINEFRKLPDGASLKLFECMSCGAGAFTGVDKSRRVVIQPVDARGEGK